MSVNRHLPHVMVLPEDDANRQLANGFQMQVDPVRLRQMRVLPVAGGWNEVLEQFLSDHAGEMDLNTGRLMVLLIDFDCNAGRLDYAKNRIPERLRDRVFIVGAWSEPEDLKRALGSYETIGAAMARDCRDQTEIIWGHALLQHDAAELSRLREQVYPILF